MYVDGKITTYTNSRCVDISEVDRIHIKKYTQFSVESKNGQLREDKSNLLRKGRVELSWSSSKKKIERIFVVSRIRHWCMHPMWTQKSKWTMSNSQRQERCERNELWTFGEREEKSNAKRHCLAIFRVVCESERTMRELGVNRRAKRGKVVGGNPFYVNGELFHPRSENFTFPTPPSTNATNT